LRKRISSTAGALAAAFLFLAPYAAFADTNASNTYTIKGIVVDAGTGLGLAGVKLTTNGPTVKTETSNAAGRFEISGLAPGFYALQMVLPGYDNTLSEQFSVGGGYSLPLTLALQRTTGNTQIRTLGRTTVTAAASLQKSAVIYRQVSGNTMQRTGVTRSADAVQVQGGVDNTSSNTATFGDDVHLAIRGIGNLETVTLLDGHPVALGLPGGLNWEISPSFGLRAVNTVYGAGGGDLYGVDAIGGVLDMQTLDPTLTPQLVLTQGYGTFSKLTSALTATGTFEQRWGYALALGTTGSNGSIPHAIFTQPAAAFDASATDPAVVALQNYPVESQVANRSALYKVQYGLGNNARISAVAVNSYYWDNKTGNGDGDYLPWNTALAIGNQKLANYTPSFTGGTVSALNPPNCPAGQFVGTGTGGNAYGFGTDGLTPDGGTTCVTPSQWAILNTGWQGAGPAWQAFTNQDYQVRFNANMGPNTINVDTFTDLYTHTYDRTWELPYLLVPGGTDPVTGNPNCLLAAPCTLTSNPFWYNEAINNAGVVGTYSIVGQNNEFGIGGYYDNTTTRFSTAGVDSPDPAAHETSAFFRDVWHPINSPLSTYISAYFKHSTVTNTSFVDPRIAFVATRPNDVFRAAFGYISTQPALTDVFTPFTPNAPGSLAGNVRCGTLNSVGGGGNPNALPERASDTEFSWGHRFGEDSTMQLSLYSEPIWNQLYTQTIPVLSFPASYFGPQGYSSLNTYANIYASTCGGTTAQAFPFLGADGILNIGNGYAEGIDLQGRQHITPSFFVDYSYATNSSVAQSVPDSILSGNLTLVPGSQLPNIPLHKYNFALDYTFDKMVELRSETYFISSNNDKNLPAYNYTNFIITVNTGHRGQFNAIINNLFQQNTFAQGLIGDGVPLALNKFAAPSDYQPLIGAGATEQFGLLPRRVEFIYSYRVR